MAVVSPSIELQPRNGATKHHFRTLIVGSGTAGIAVSARLRAAGQNEIAIADPSDKHYYQPLWTLVDGGIMPKEESERAEAVTFPLASRGFAIV